MSANISSSEQAKFGFLVPVIFAAVLLLSALVLYLIFRRNRRTTVRVDAHTATATRTRTPLQRNIIPQRREHVEYRVDNSLSRHGETIDMKDKEDERLQLVLQSIICKKLNKTLSVDNTDIVDEEEGRMTSKSIHETMDKVSSQVTDQIFSKSKSIGKNMNTLNCYSSTSCSICCESYHLDDTIACSKNNKCNHVYHEACIINWLLKHDDCPLCRRNYTSVK